MTSTQGLSTENPKLRYHLSQTTSGQLIFEGRTNNTTACSSGVNAPPFYHEEQLPYLLNAFLQSVLRIKLELFDVTHISAATGAADSSSWLKVFRWLTTKKENQPFTDTHNRVCKVCHRSFQLQWRSFPLGNARIKLFRSSNLNEGFITKMIGHQSPIPCGGGSYLKPSPSTNTMDHTFEVHCFLLTLSLQRIHRNQMTKYCTEMRLKGMNFSSNRELMNQLRTIWTIGSNHWLSTTCGTKQVKIRIDNKTSTPFRSTGKIVSAVTVSHVQQRQLNTQFHWESVCWSGKQPLGKCKANFLLRLSRVAHVLSIMANIQTSFKSLKLQKNSTIFLWNQSCMLIVWAFHINLYNALRALIANNLIVGQDAILSSIEVKVLEESKNEWKSEGDVQVISDQDQSKKTVL